MGYECLYGNTPDRSKPLFSDTLVYNIIIFEMHINDLYIHTVWTTRISDNSASKLQERICGIIPSFVKKSQSIHILKKNMRHHLTDRKEKKTWHIKGFVNSLIPSEAYMRQWTKSESSQIMAWRPWGAKPLTKPMLAFYQLDHSERYSMKIESKHENYLHWRKRICKYRLQNICQFIFVVMGWNHMYLAITFIAYTDKHVVYFPV